VRVTVAEIAIALKSAGGIRSAAAESLGITRQGLEKRIKSSPRLQQVERDVRELVLDRAEAVVLKGVQADDLQSARYLLDRWGKHRGFTTRTEVTGAAEAPVEVNVNWGDLTDEQLEAFARAARLADPKASR
jgi:hypothetical protein